MKKIILSALFAVAMTTAFSQMQINLGGAYFKGNSENNNDVSRWGASAAVKGLIADRVTIGLGARFFPKVEQDLSRGGVDYLRTSNISQVYVPIEFILNTASETFQPYLGGDLGLQFSNNSWSASSGSSTLAGVDNKKTFVYLAPKIGFNVGITPAIGIFAEGSYGLTFSDGNQDVTIGSSTFEDGPTGKHWLFNGGLYFRLTGAN